MNFKTLAAVGVSLVLVVAIAFVLASASFQIRIPNVATVKTIGASVFWDQNCTEDVTTIDWGLLEPSTNKTFTVYVKSESNIAVTLSSYAANWNPTNATSYIAFTANPNNVIIEPAQVLQVDFTLHVDVDIEGITSFSFDIYVCGE